MCKKRILARLRSKRLGVSLRKHKPFLGIAAEQILEVCRNFSQKRKEPPVKGFISEGPRFLAALKSQMTCPEKGLTLHLRNVIIAASQLTKAVDLSQAFASITSQELDPSTVSNFIHSVKKLARYQECCHFLYQSARKLAMFKNVEVVLISLDESLFARSQAPVRGELTFANTWERCHRSNGHIIGYKAMLKTLMKTPGEGNDKFIAAVRKSLRESKTHAEVQLVAHYELHPPPIMPRVITSNKDACYLCDLFIKVHGKFHIHGTHGRLYTGWRLPQLPAFNKVQAQLNGRLEDRIRRATREIVAVSGRKPTIYPMESALFRLSGSLSSLATVVMSAVGLPRSASVDTLRATSPRSQAWKGKEPVRSPDQGSGSKDIDPRKGHQRRDSGIALLSDSSGDDNLASKTERSLTPRPFQRRTISDPIPEEPEITEKHTAAVRHAEPSTGELSVLGVCARQSSVSVSSFNSELTYPAIPPPAEEPLAEKVSRPSSSKLHTTKPPAEVDQPLQGRLPSSPDNNPTTPITTPQRIDKPITLLQSSKPDEANLQNADIRGAEIKNRNSNHETPPPLPPLPVSPIPPIQEVNLIPGQPLTFNLDDDHPSSCYSPGSINIYFESTSASTKNNSSRENTTTPRARTPGTPFSNNDTDNTDGLEMHIHRLIPDDAAILSLNGHKRAQQHDVVRVDTLPFKKDVDCGSQGCVYLGDGDHVVRVEMLRRGGHRGSGPQKGPV